MNDISCNKLLKFFAGKTIEMILKNKLTSVS